MNRRDRPRVNDRSLRGDVLASVDAVAWYNPLLLFNRFLSDYAYVYVHVGRVTRRATRRDKTVLPPPSWVRRQPRSIASSRYTPLAQTATVSAYRVTRSTFCLCVSSRLSSLDSLRVCARSQLRPRRRQEVARWLHRLLRLLQLKIDYSVNQTTPNLDLTSCFRLLEAQTFEFAKLD